MVQINYPGYSVPQPSQTKITDLLDLWDRGVEQGKADRYEREAPDAFSAYIDSLYGGRPAAAPGAGAQTAGLVGGSHDAVAAAEDPMLAAYFKNTRRSESAGNDAAANPNSSALGRYQFLEGTWSDLMAQHPELGLTADGRTDAGQQEKAIRAFTADNARTLKSAGIGVDPGALYAAHFLGAGGASKVLQGDPNSPVSAYVDSSVISANPQLQNMTVGQFREWAASKGGNQAGGYAAPTATTAPTDTAGNGLPPRDVMLRLFKNPETRPLAIELAKSAQTGRAAKPIEINNRLVDPLTGRVLADFSDESKPLTDLAKLRVDLKAGRISQAEFDAAVAKETAINGGTTLRVNPETGDVEFQQGGPAGGKGMKITEGQGKDVVYWTRGLDANKSLMTMDEQLTNLPASLAKVAPLGLGNYAVTPEFRQAKVAADNFLAAILRKDTGAAITTQEFDLYGPMFLPVPGDDPETIKMKRRAREVALLAIKSGMGTAEAIAEANRIALGIETATPILDAEKAGEAAPQQQRVTKTINGVTYFQDEAGDWYEE